MHLGACRCITLYADGWGPLVDTLDAPILKVLDEEGVIQLWQFDRYAWGSERGSQQNVRPNLRRIRPPQRRVDSVFNCQQSTVFFKKNKSHVYRRFTG